METAKQVPGYKQIFEADAGNMEGYRLDEHTETTLRALDTNFANKIPVGLLPILKLSLLTHDIGKGEAARNADKENQHDYNAAEADRFMEAIGVDEPLRKLIIGMTGRAQDLTTRYLVKGERKAYGELAAYCTSLLREYDPTWITPRNVDALASMCMIIQTCDSIAYTDYSITRTERFGVHYRNHPAFNKNFAQKSQFQRRQATFKANAS